MKSHSLESKALFIAMSTFASVLTGCGMSGGTGTNAASLAQAGGPAVMQGRVHGGNNPVTGSTITIYTVGMNTPSSGVSGYGSGATALATTTTDSTGSFSFGTTKANTYKCPSGSPYAYIVASGGNPGLASGTVNGDITLMAALGSCPAGSTLVGTFPYLDINEVTTVAAVWALQQFMAPPATGNTNAPNIGAPNTSYSNGLASPNNISVESAVIGMQNAFATANMLVDVSSGASPNTNVAYATPESAKINTLADIINTDPSSDNTCSNLFTAATPSGTTAADTTQALWYIAQNPITNLTTLYGYVGGTAAPFLPDLKAPASDATTASFNDATVAINYAPVSGGAPVLGAAFGLAIDAYGNAWFGNQGLAAVSAATPSAAVAASIAELGPNGAALLAPITTFPLSTTGGSYSQYPSGDGPTNSRTFIKPYQLAIDLTNRAWLVNYTDIAYTNIGGTNQTTCSNVNVCPGDVAVSSASSGAGTAASTTMTGYTVGDTPTGVTIDGSNNVFVANTSSNYGTGLSRSISKMSAIGATNFTASATSTTAPTLPGASAIIGIDNNPNVPGGIVWALTGGACQQTIGTLTSATTIKDSFGTVGLYGGTSLSDNSSEIIPSYDPAATLGAGTGGTAATSTAPPIQGNCNATNIYVGQLLQSNFFFPTAVAFDKNNGAWVTDQIYSSLGFDGLTYITAPTYNTSGTSPVITLASSTALTNGVASTFSYAYNSMSGVTMNTASAPTAGTTLNVPEFPEVDGNNNLWVSTHGTSVAEASVNTSGSAPVISLLTPGQGSTYASQAYGIGFVHNISSSEMLAIDPSGNVWITNAPGNTTTYVNQSAGKTGTGNSVTVIVGAAGPVVTPISLRLANSLLGQKP
jgi:hypothetical protein